VESVKSVESGEWRELMDVSCGVGSASRVEEACDETLRRGEDADDL
jgi:hypothetical protein